ncbi:Uncharacterised protein [Serratia ficaria]|uniref:hypothetical protein n=1 Tax=Serratia ficaria TaxID=61651 RepID=UPI0021C4FB62|nr:hypothetical protein [Serratia ficaria]CAI2786440.1 Uncharacterised protein [Serratia ficaria]
MNVYEMEGFLRGKCMPRDILVNESTAEYLVRKLNEATTVKADRDALERQLLMSEAKCKGYFSDAAAALIKCDALAVENAALKDVFGTGEAVVNFLTIALRHTEYDSIDISDVALAFKMSLPETPATSAALAAIEARVWAEAKDLAKSILATDSADCIDFLFDGKIQQLREAK